MSGPVRGRFALTDHHGQSVTEKSYRGRWMLVLFGFTHCQVVCPRALSKYSAVLDDLDPASAKVQPLYVTVDPERDSPEVMGAFLEHTYPRFTGLTGQPPAIAAAMDSFSVFTRRRADAADPDGYAVVHTAMAFVFDPVGEYLTHFSDAAPASTILARMRKLLSDAVDPPKR
jgi:protein SCO1/2